MDGVEKNSPLDLCQSLDRGGYDKISTPDLPQSLSREGYEEISPQDLHQSLGRDGHEQTPRQDLRQSLDRDGYVIIRSAVREPELTKLRFVCHPNVRLARAGHWPHVRILPKQFPLWKFDHETVKMEGIWVSSICFIHQ
jgi:hypothetical protein